MTNANDWGFERIDRRVRVLLDGHTLADSKDGMRIIEHHSEARYYFPTEDVDMQVLVPTNHVQQDGHRGVSHWWNVRVGEREVEKGAWSYPELTENRPDLRGYISFDWRATDQMFEEEEELIPFPRNPIVRLDVFGTSRHVRVVKDGVVIAESNNPCMMCETKQPVRYYFRQENVRMDCLTLSGEKSACPYKGSWAIFWSAKVNDKVYENIAWSYPDPYNAKAKRVTDCIAFYTEHTDIYVDGELLEKPKVEPTPSHLTDIGIKL